MINGFNKIKQKLRYFEDTGFVYVDSTHTYTYGGLPYTSATQFVDKFYKPFDTDFWSKTKAYEEQTTQAVILKRWADKAHKSQVLGTNVHQYIEDYFRLGLLPVPLERDPEETRKINMFKELVESGFFDNLEPVGSEIKVFSKQFPIAGTLDQLFINKINGEVYVFDWKSNEVFKTRVYGRLLTPFNKLDDITVNKYSIQLSIYDRILEEAGIEVSKRFIIHLGQEIGVYDLQDLKKEVNLAFKKLI